MDKKSLNIAEYANIARAIAKLFAPLAEIVIHDLSTQKICHISGELSGRKIGDDSLIDFSANDLETSFYENFTKINFDGRLIKSISIPLKEDNEIKAIMCINCDISIFKDMHALSGAMLSTQTEQPKPLFVLDWQEEIHKAIHSFIKSMRWDFANLTGSQKKSHSTSTIYGTSF
jgi:predicted transcriptional regulator YheO